MKGGSKCNSPMANNRPYLSFTNFPLPLPFPEVLNIEKSLP